MGEASFTPGPWRVDDAGDIVAGPYNVCIPYATKPADKAMMAAAWDLYEAVKELLASHRPGEGQCCGAADKGLAALAKANGETAA